MISLMCIHFSSNILFSEITNFSIHLTICRKSTQALTTNVQLKLKNVKLLARKRPFLCISNKSSLAMDASSSLTIFKQQSPPLYGCNNDDTAYKTQINQLILHSVLNACIYSRTSFKQPFVGEQKSDSGHLFQVTT